MWFRRYPRGQTDTQTNTDVLITIRWGSEGMRGKRDCPGPTQGTGPLGKLNDLTDYV